MDSYIPPSLDGLDISSFDPFGHAFRNDPRAFHAELLASSPGFVMMEGVPSAYVAGYEQVAAVLRDFKDFSSLKPRGLPGMQRIDFFNSLPVMNYSDPPDHTRRRRVVSPAFAPKRTELLVESASTLLDTLLDGVAAKGTFDAVDDLCKPLSIKILLSRFMAIRPEHQTIFLNYVTTLPLLDELLLGDPKPPAYLAAWEEGKAFCREQQELARRGECDNLVGLIANSVDGGTLNEDEMMAMMVVLLIGGVSTLTGAAAAGLLNLAQNPQFGPRLVAEPTLAEAHLDESLRLDPPVSLVMRFASKDAKVGGKVIPAGMPVYAMIAVACHDPAVFPQPYRFDPTRINAKAHLAFGHGIHTCIGNTVTRAIAPLIFRKVAERFPNLRPAGEDFIDWDVSTARARHLKHLMLSV